MPILITTDAGQVKVGGTILPGSFESLEISGAIKMDEVEIKGKEEKVTQAVSYENARIRLTVALVPEEEDGDCTADIAIYQKVFRQSPSQQKPGVYQIVNKHAQARNISQVVFADFRTYEDNRSDKVLVTCEFVEHVPIQIKVATQKDQTGTKKKSGAKTPSSIRKDAYSSTKMGDFRRVQIEDKTEKTPAKDNREPGLGESLLAWLKGGDIG